MKKNRFIALLLVLIVLMSLATCTLSVTEEDSVSSINQDEETQYSDALADMEPLPQPIQMPEQEDVQPTSPTPTPVPTPSVEPTPEPLPPPPPPINPDDIGSRGAIVMTLDGEVLFEKNADVQMRPASLGKMMLVYAVYHYISNNPNRSLTDMITITESDAQVVNRDNGGFHYGDGIFAKPNAQSNARLLAGDTLSVDDLLTLVIMPSAGDASLALARYVSGGRRAFLDYMQVVARDEIGIDMRLNSVHGGTLSVNANSPQGGRFTPRGAALLAQALLLDFGEQVLEKTEMRTFSVTVGDRTIYYTSSNPLMFEAEGEPPVYGVTGMKAGRLGTLPDGVTRNPSVSDANAFANYMLTATRDGETIIVVVMEHPWISNWTGENHGLRRDLAILVEYGFAHINSAPEPIPELPHMLLKEY